MARGLRLARGDADLGADQPVEQRGLADIGPADDRDVAGAVRGQRLRPGRKLISLARGFLLGAAPAGALAQRPYAELGDGAFDLEILLVGLAARGHHRVLRQREPAPLQEFLQQRLGILARGRGIDGVEQRRRTATRTTLRAASNPPSRNTAPITASTASARIEGRRAPPLFSSPSPSRSCSPKAKRCGDGGKRLLVDQVGAQPRQLAFGQRGKPLIEFERHDAIEHAVAEKLEALVVGRAVAAVGQRLPQQFGVGESDVRG